MRKKLAFILIITILINTIIPKYIYATEDPTARIPGNTTYNEIGEHSQNSGKNTSDQVFDKGTADVTTSGGSSRTEELGETASSSKTVIGTLSGFFLVLPYLVNFFMVNVTKMFQEATDGNINGNFLIENLVFDKYTLFKINFLDIPSELGNENTKGVLKVNVAIWYYSLRNVAIVANLIILIYIGIRMAISTVAEERAKYKKMFFNWVVSFILIFIMHYIIAVLLTLQEWLLEILWEFAKGKGFEESIINDIFGTIGKVDGWDTVPVIITIYVLVYYELKFFLMYFKRMLSVGFLFVISPLITITYAIDAVKDGKSQVYQKWFKEMLFNIFIQVIHAIVYLIFIISAAEIAKEVPIMGALLFMTLSRANKVVKTTFKMSSNITKSESLLNKIKK